MYLTKIRDRTPTPELQNVLFEDLIRSLYNTLPEELPAARRQGLSYFETLTYNLLPEKMPLPPARYMDQFQQLAAECDHFIQENPDPKLWYSQFYLPKKSGGMREIHAPIYALAELQRKIVYHLSHVPGKELPTVHAHNAAFGYVAGRSCLKAIQLHKNSNWFLKLDIKDFFPSVTAEVLVDALRDIYPTCYIPREIRQVLMFICTREGSLPQGAPSSPWLSNMVLLGMDHTITQTVYNYEKIFCQYTRYADDLLLSSVNKAHLQTIQPIVERIIERAGFQVNPTKTRLGSIAGSNWNLGLMLNKEHAITLGHEKKQRIRAMVFNFLKDYLADKRWPQEDVAVLQGQLAYFKHIEPNYVQYVIDHYSEKTGVNFYSALKQALQP